jgi:ubiquinone/menaquinone biosynthesis C-methylase UbiE
MINNFLSNKKLIFDSWASSYDWLFPSVFYQAIHKRLLEYVDLPNPANILDLGCGTGRLLQRLATEFHQFRGTGLDLSSNMVRQARLFWKAKQSLFPLVMVSLTQFLTLSVSCIIKNQNRC